MTAAPPRSLRLAALLVRFRLRSLWNALWRPPRGRPLRLAWLLVLLAPLAYVGLFATALDVVARSATLAEQGALLGLVVGSILLASLVGKMATTEAVIGGTGENEFLLVRPVALDTLVVARSLAGAVTDVFGALFLLPVLLAAALVWELGAAGAAIAAVTSILAHVAVSALSQAGQILVVRVVPPGRRRAVWVALALLATLAMAGLWVVAIWVLRRPEDTVAALRPLLAVLRYGPGAPLAAPLARLLHADAAGAAVALGGLLALVLLAVALSAVAARWAGKAGWEQAGAPWAEAAPRAPTGRPLTILSKDLRLLLRERSRLATLIALPVVLVGIQIFGSAGWDWTTASPRNAAVLAFSVAAYMATLGPLGHMAAERRSFWLLLTVPAPLGRLLAYKAVFWSAIVGGVAALAWGAVVAIGHVALSGDAVGAGALALLGAVTVSWLAVGVAGGAADLAEDGSPLGLGTVYLFMLVAGLFNVVLLADGETRVRGLVLYLGAVALHWLTGVEHAARAFDPPEPLLRRLVAADGASLAILLFLGLGAQRMVAAMWPAGEAAWTEIAWAGVIASGAGIYVVRRQSPGPRRGLAAWLGLAPVLGLILGLSLGALAAAARWRGVPAISLGPLLARAAAEELVFRGIIQRALRERWRRVRRGSVLALAAAAAMALAAGGRPMGAMAAAACLAPGVALALTGRLRAALVARFVAELAAVL